MNKQPNIIICTCDQLRAFEVGCYGNQIIQTPHVDRLASEGVRYETAVTNYPVCMAARSVLISGQYNRTCTGGIGNVNYSTIPGDCCMPEYPYSGRPHLKNPTLAEILKDNGYFTSVIGKWHIHSWPNDIGFDEYLIPRVHHCHTGQSFTENGKEEFIPEGFSVDFESERVKKFLENHKQDEKPFFLYYNISPPHCPVADAPEKYRKMYDPKDIPIRANVDLDKPLKDQDHWFKVYSWDFKYYNMHLPYTENLPENYTLRSLIAEYYGMTTWMDTAVGRMLKELDDNGLAENTIVLFTSDHGDNLGSHRLVQKGGPNEESIRIPFVVRCPSLIPESAVETNSVASLVDIAPTLLSLSGIPIPSHFHGKSLANSLTKQKEISSDNYAIVETGAGAAIRSASHMY